MRFDPPEEGLEPGESIVWTRREGTSGKVIVSGFLFFMLSPVALVGAYNLYGLSFVGAVTFLLLVILLSITVAFVRERRTRYYLTTERIVEARGGVLLKEVPLDHFAGRPLDHFIESKVTHHTNNRPVYTIRVYDPTSDEIFELKGLDRSSTRAFQRIGDTVECPYCGLNNTAVSTRCRNCAAIL